MIDEAAALEIARARAVEKGWAFAEPISVEKRLNWSGRLIRFEITTNFGYRGSIARFTIDATTGAILSEGYVSR